jgi:hypothetical protein
VYPRFALRLGLMLVLTLGCSAPGASPTPASPSPLPRAPSPSSPPSGFYLRLWTTQALPPAETFGWLPPLTITGNTVIDGMVAIPMIYPGPLLIQRNARTVSDQGIAAIVDEADRLGLLGQTTDFNPAPPAPGAPQAHIEIVIEGVRRKLLGSADLAVDCGVDGRCQAEPRTPAAFAAFWHELLGLDPWLGSQLGADEPYQPERIAVRVIPPQAEQGLPQQPMAWPLDVPFAQFGVPYFGGERCATVSGADLEVLLPAVRQANQLTVFTDSDAVERSLAVRVLVPGEPSPCATEASGR